MIFTFHVPPIVRWQGLGADDFTAPYRRWLEGMRMLEGIDARTEMDQRQLRDILNNWVTCGK